MKNTIFCSLALISLGSYGSRPEDIIAKAHKAATKEPESNHFFNAAMVFDWEANRLYQIYTKPERITDIALETGESLLSVAGGDSHRTNWVSPII
jgi:type IV secretion system protein VirB9